MGKLKSYKDHLLKELQDPEQAAAYLCACLEDEDPYVFLLALRDLTEARGGMTKLSKNSSLSRQSLYRTLSKTGNPKLNSVCTILTSLGFHFSILPISSKSKTRSSLKASSLKKPTIRKKKSKI
jgi:probable addiction module antidote protein